MITRRELVTGAAAFALSPSHRPILAYAASYSSPQGPEGSRGYGQGIYLLETNPTTGTLTQRDLFPNPNNPSWLAFDPTHTHLYSANETAEGSVSTYSIDRPTGKLTLLNTVSSEGAGSAHVSVHPSGKFVLVANYTGGTIAVLPIQPDGSLGRATSIIHDEGPTGPQHPTSAPPGSFAISGHDRPHAHMIQSDPSGRFVLAADLALDRILIWKFDPARGSLTPNDPPFTSLPPGDGPRHFLFHPRGDVLYSLQEESSTLAVFDYDATRGALTLKQTLSTLPKDFAGTNFTSELALSPDARFLYAANRLHDTIAWFTIRPAGTLILRGEEWTRGDYPRSFTIDPSGNYLYSCNQRSDAIASFRVNRQTGALTFTGHYTPIGTPAMLLFYT